MRKTRPLAPKGYRTRVTISEHPNHVNTATKNSQATGNRPGFARTSSFLPQRRKGEAKGSQRKNWGGIGRIARLPRARRSGCAEPGKQLQERVTDRTERGEGATRNRDGVAACDKLREVAAREPEDDCWKVLGHATSYRDVAARLETVPQQSRNSTISWRAIRAPLQKQNPPRSEAIATRIQGDGDLRSG